MYQELLVPFSERAIVYFIKVWLFFTSENKPIFISYFYLLNITELSKILEF